MNENAWVYKETDSQSGILVWKKHKIGLYLAQDTSKKLRVIILKSLISVTFVIFKKRMFVLLGNKKRVC